MRKLLLLLLMGMVAFTVLAEEKEVELEKGKGKDEPRSLVYVPTVTYEESTVYLYSEVVQGDVQVLITDLQTGETICSAVVTLSPATPYIIMAGQNLDEGLYRIDLTVAGEEYYGVFE